MLDIIEGEQIDKIYDITTLYLSIIVYTSLYGF